MNIKQLTSTLFASAALVGAVAAQGNEARSTKSVIVISENGKTYKKVIENGKVVEESGDKSLGENVDIRIGGDGTEIKKLVDRARKGGGESDQGKKAKERRTEGGQKSKRRIVINGDTVLDGSEIDFDLDLGDLDLGDLPKQLRKMLKGEDGLGALIERARHDAKKGGGSRIIINKDGKTIFDEIGGLEELDLDLPAELSDILDGRGLDIEKLIEKAQHGDVKSQGRVIVKQDGKTIFDELFDDMGKGGLRIGGFDWDELDLPMELEELFDGKHGGVVLGMPEIEISELGDLPESLREMLEGLEGDAPKKVLERQSLKKRSSSGKLDAPKKIERRVRADVGEVKTLEAEVKRLQKQVEALQRELKKAQKSRGRELF